MLFYIYLQCFTFQMLQEEILYIVGVATVVTQNSDDS